MIQPVGLPEHAALARRLGDSVGDDGAPAAPRRLMLASVFGEPALPKTASQDDFCGCDLALKHSLDAAERIGVGQHDGQIAEEQGGIDTFVGTTSPWQGRLPAR